MTERNSSILVDLWKMVYKRPKYVKANYTQELTGPWFDTNFYTDDISGPGKLEVDSGSVLKSSLVSVWDNLPIDKVL